MEFREQFCLKDRDSFTIDPKINENDAAFYFGRHQQDQDIKKQLRRAFVDPGVPKMVFFGSFGSGKTHTLFHLQHYLKHERPTSCTLEPKTVFLDIEMHSKAACADWHLQLFEAVGKEAVTTWVQTIFNDVKGKLNSELRTLFDDPNMAAAAEALLMPNTALSAWKWLTAQKLSNAEMEGLGVTRSLGQTGPGDMAKCVIGIGALAERNGQKLIFLADEAEQFASVLQADALHSLQAYLRKLAEQANSTAGFLICAYALTADDLSEVLNFPATQSRIGLNNYVYIPPLPAVEDVQNFLKEMLLHLIDQPKAELKIQSEKLGVLLETFPFTAEAFDLLCQFASDVQSNALPRNVIKAVNECAIQAWDEGKPTIDIDIVNDIAPAIFG